MRKLKQQVGAVGKENEGEQRASRAEAIKGTRTLPPAAGLPQGVRRSSRLSSIGGLSVASVALIGRSAASRTARTRPPLLTAPQKQPATAPSSALPLTAQEEVKRKSSGPPALPQLVTCDGQPLLPPSIQACANVSVEALSVLAQPSSLSSVVEAERKLRQHQQALLPIDTRCTSLLSPIKSGPSSATLTLARAKKPAVQRRLSVSAKGRRARPSLIPCDGAMTFHGIAPHPDQLKALVKAVELKEQQRRASLSASKTRAAPTAAPEQTTASPVRVEPIPSPAIVQSVVEAAVPAIVLRRSCGTGVTVAEWVRHDDAEVVMDMAAGDQADLEMGGQSKRVEARGVVRQAAKVLGVSVAVVAMAWATGYCQLLW